MTRAARHHFFAAFFLFLSFFTGIFAESLIDQDFGFSIDLPEGYEISDYTEDGMSYIFTHDSAPITLVLKIYHDEAIADSQAALMTSFQKLGVSADVADVEWCARSCSVASFSMYLDQSYDGWAAAAPLAPEHSHLVLLCYTPTAEGTKWNQFIISTLNSLCVDDEYYRSPGIIMTYAFPKTTRKTVQFQIAGKTITTTLDEYDEEAADFLVDLEFSVLTLYMSHSAKFEAWERYYRMIYRDSFGRLESAISDIYDALYPECERQNPENPMLAYAQTLLSWVQGFDYQRAGSKYQTDFTSLPAVLCGKGSDCDSRSLLICALLKAAGVECVFQFSPVYAHALASVELNAPGQTFEVAGRQFLAGETTAKVTWGMLAQDVADRSKWIPVILP